MQATESYNYKTLTEKMGTEAATWKVNYFTASNHLPQLWSQLLTN
jgi:hypothetical protein